MTPFLRCDAVFSPCVAHGECDKACKQRPWRYTLVREFPFCEVDRVLLVIALNPSTATHLVPDPTITKLMGFTQRWGFSELVVCNLFAWRSTDQKVLKQVPNPIGPDNDLHIEEQVKRAAQVVVAWGKPGRLKYRDAAVLNLLKSVGVQPWCFGYNGDGTCVHPLYQRNDVELVRYEPGT